MVYEKDEKYYTVCDDCGKTNEIQRATYIKNLKKDHHYCSSCRQKGERNHAFGKSPWNKGLTKNDDDRIKVYGEHCSEVKRGTAPWNKGCTYEELMGTEWTNSYKEKASKSKKGKPNYKRRKSTNRDRSWRYFRKLCKTLLYTAWTRPIMERDDFKCQRCGAVKDLEVHHIKTFRAILIEAAEKEHLTLNDYKNFTDEEFERLRDTIVEMHEMEDGITLCKKCHMEIDKYRRKFDA